LSELIPPDDPISLEDLAHLAPADLRAVFRELGSERVILALSDASPALRRRLLERGGSSDRPIPKPSLAASPDQVRTARQALVEIVCRLSRVGQIAFDHPDDILDQVA
jgi:flagellar motor switch protein FliG